MPFIAVGRENSGIIRIYYEDHGTGPVVLLVHGYLQDCHAWEKQETALLAAGYRVITYDRRGCGNSSKPSSGYDYATLAADLGGLLDHLDVREVTLVGFAAGTGDVVRYLAARGAGRIRQAVLTAPLPPYLLRTTDNPLGIERAIFDEMIAAVEADRPAAAKTYLDKSYNIDVLGGSYVSDQAWQNSFQVAMRAPAAAAREGIRAWMEDFRADSTLIRVPVLVIQGEQDRIFPPEATGNRLPSLLADCRHLVVPAGPHHIIWTNAAEINAALLAFLRQHRRSGGQPDS